MHSQRVQWSTRATTIQSQKVSTFLTSNGEDSDTWLAQNLPTNAISKHTCAGSVQERPEAARRGYHIRRNTKLTRFWTSSVRRVTHFVSCGDPWKVTPDTGPVLRPWSTWTLRYVNSKKTKSSRTLTLNDPKHTYCSLPHSYYWSTVVPSVT